jgi:lipoprotein-anchoring transpeptidase ErfK/SrfK
MRSFVILLILAAGGWFGWRWYSDRQAAAKLAADQAAAAQHATEVPPAPAPGPTPTAQQPATGIIPADAPIPPELKAEYDRAEGIWQQVVASGANPVGTAKAPLLDHLYSDVLQGVYNKPGQKTFELKLIAERLTPLGDSLFFSKTPFPDDESGLFESHEVQPGENPDAIARKYGMSRELLNRLRGRDPNDSRLGAGDRLKVVKIKEKGGFLLHVDKSDYYLDCYVGGAFARRYPISHGAPETPTPTGKTHLTGRELNPSWTNPKNGKVYGPDDPENILGKVWMAFSPDGIDKNGLGIHGYTGPNPKMQAQVSNGCIRLDTPQAQELFQTLANPDRSPTAVELAD